MGLARRLNARELAIKHVVDVGGGSGCFSIALVQANPELRATILELPAVCPVTNCHIAEGSVTDRVRTVGCDMFSTAWPTAQQLGAEVDAVLFSNVFHDWSQAQNRHLATQALSLLRKVRIRRHGRCIGSLLIPERAMCGPWPACRAAVFCCTRCS